jgi:hypothetical protein
MVDEQDAKELYAFRSCPRTVELIADRKIRMPENKRGLWTRSRQVEVAPERWKPLLELLAEDAIDGWDPETMVAHWADRDWTNESVLNVDVTMKPNAVAAALHKKLKVKAGTPEYQRRWRKANADKVRAYHRDRQAKMRAALKQVAALDHMSPAEAAAVAKGESLFEKLGIK